MIQRQEANPDGLHIRYKVLKGDGSEPDPRAVYFVLRIDSHGDDRAHIEACRVALAAYCGWVRATAVSAMLRRVASEASQLLYKLRQVPFTEPGHHDGRATR